MPSSTTLPIATCNIVLLVMSTGPSRMLYTAVEYRTAQQGESILSYTLLSIPYG